MIDEPLREAADASDNEELKSLRRSSSETSDVLKDSVPNLKSSVNESSDDEGPRKPTKKRVKRFSDSDNDSDKGITQIISDRLHDERSGSEENPLQKSALDSSSDSEDGASIFKNTQKSRIQSTNGVLSDSSDSGNDRVKNVNKNSSISHNSRLQKNNISDCNIWESDGAVKNEEQQLRMINKRHKLKDKFKSLVTSRGKEQSPTNNENDLDKSASESSNSSGAELASIEKIKQKIKERMTFKPSICDPDTSDDESSQQKPVYKQKRERKSTKLTSPKPQRMSAKQAMENMQKIKSESNRMLREKEVSLPYHRPKALSLKDIMSRRKPAVSADGKALPIKMNKEQLKQYAKMLEVRQKEMMELCKSESEEEDVNGTLAGDKESATNAENKTQIAENGGNEHKTDENEINESNTHVKVPTTSENTHSNDVDHTTCVQENSHIQINENVPAECTDENKQNNSDEKLPEERDSETCMQLVNIDSVNSINAVKLTASEDTTVEAEMINKDATPQNTDLTVNNENEAGESKDNIKTNTEVDSQLISLHFDSENTEIDTVENQSSENANAYSVTISNNKQNNEREIIYKENSISEVGIECKNTVKEKEDSDLNGDENGVEGEMNVNNGFSDDDINMEDIDNIIENAEIIKGIEDKVNSSLLVRDKPLNLTPKLTGSPGMVIDLDGTDAAPRKSGVEMLKERFTFFSKLKTPEEMEREREKRFKPGTQLKKLKQDLEEQIAEQRSLEWAKRLDDEKQQQKELKALRGEESDEDEIDKIEAKLDNSGDQTEENDDRIEENDDKEMSDAKDGSESEEEPIEDDVVIKDKPRVNNPLLSHEAEESDCDDEDRGKDDVEPNDEVADGDDNDQNDDDDDDDSESDDSDSSEEEEENPSKKGRILKAFEDSDDEDVNELIEQSKLATEEIKDIETKTDSGSVVEISAGSQVFSQDDVIQLAQRHQPASDDLFTSQESALLVSEPKEKSKDITENDEHFTQTFSILDTSKQPTAELELNNSGKESVFDTQQLNDENLAAVNAMCSTSLPKDVLPSQITTTQTSQSQTIGEDVLALCTGQFYDNQFVSQVQENSEIPLGDSQQYDSEDDQSQESQKRSDIIATDLQSTVTTELRSTEALVEINSADNIKENKTARKIEDDNLRSILDELKDPEFDSPKPNKFFTGGKSTQNVQHNETQLKKKFIFDSDDETEGAEVTEKEHKKLKKKKLEKRALQISDDEEEPEQGEAEDLESEIEDEDMERIVEYDSEENEIEVKPQQQKKKRKTTEFFENEAELTSEDEWVGSGDEDERGLDRMEREEGDDEIFHQGQLQRELGQIHMRDVLDQDKREVRIIQELLFEDGDLGGGGRQRKFRWKNMEGEEEMGTVVDEFADTQEEEFESEELWRKQRHERDTFLRQMHNKDETDESLNVSVNRTSIIKANLSSKTMSSLLMEVNSSKIETTERSAPVVLEKKTVYDVPSPKKPFPLLQQTFQGSLLSRGRGALARLAALATPLATDDESRVGAVATGNRRNFVFTALTPEVEPKVTKRKAESNPSTPKLVKKMRTDEKLNQPKSSLLDHFKV